MEVYIEKYSATKEGVKRETEGGRELERRRRSEVRVVYKKIK